MNKDLRNKFQKRFYLVIFRYQFFVSLQELNHREIKTVEKAHRKRSLRNIPLSFGVTFPEFRPWNILISRFVRDNKSHRK